MEPKSFYLILLLLRELLEVVPVLAVPSPAAVQAYQTFERIGFLVLDFPTFHQYETSDWFLEAVEQDIVIL
jgi:hypothetical protein